MNVRLERIRKLYSNLSAIKSTEDSNELVNGVEEAFAGFEYAPLEKKKKQVVHTWKDMMKRTPDKRFVDEAEMDKIQTQILKRAEAGKIASLQYYDGALVADSPADGGIWYLIFDVKNDDLKEIEFFEYTVEDREGYENK